MKTILGLLLLLSVGSEAFWMDYLKAKYNYLTKGKYETSETSTTTPSLYIPQPAPIAYGYGAGIVVEYGGQSYYVGPTGYPQPPSSNPTFPYKGGPVLSPNYDTSSVYIAPSQDQPYVNLVDPQNQQVLQYDYYQQPPQ